MYHIHTFETNIRQSINHAWYIFDKYTSPRDAMWGICRIFCPLSFNLGNSPMPSVRWLPCLWLPLSTPALHRPGMWTKWLKLWLKFAKAIYKHFTCGNVWWKNIFCQFWCKLLFEILQLNRNKLHSTCTSLLCHHPLYKIPPLNKKTDPSFQGTNYPVPYINLEFSYQLQRDSGDKTKTKNTSKVSIGKFKWDVFQAAFWSQPARPITARWEPHLNILVSNWRKFPQGWKLKKKHETTT